VHEVKIQIEITELEARELLKIQVKLKVNSKLS
jgi:hypothetical protein